MAQLLTNFSSVSGRMTSGERRLALRLQEKLEDDYLVWYDVPLGSHYSHPDFLVLHPARGLLVLEVKDWKIDTLRHMDKQHCTILTNAGHKMVANPLEQVRQYAYIAVDMLKNDPFLRQSDGVHKGQLKFPYGYGVVFPNITRKQFEQGALQLVLPPSRVICRDEMVEDVEAEVLQQRLWNMFDVQFRFTLTMPDINRIRHHLFPEIRVQQGAINFESNQDVNGHIPDIIRVMDLQQEQLARSMGEGHRVVHGVAGSGKTMILAFRCAQLVQVLTKPILVLCYNATLAAHLRQMMMDRNIHHKVNVYHFHDWCGEQKRLYHLKVVNDSRQYFERIVDTVIRGVEDGFVPRAQYGAVLIDEGHDFAPEWMKLAVQMVDPDTNSLLVLYDDAQSIYRSNGLGYTLSSVGVNARGRTTILKLNYRNTREILSFAYQFSKDYLNAEDADDDHVPLLAPEAAGNSGPVPQVRGFNSEYEQSIDIAKQIQAWQNDAHDLSSIAVIIRHTRDATLIENALKKFGIPVQSLIDRDKRQTYSQKQNAITLVTLHSCKGLEFDLAIVTGLGEMPNEREAAKEFRLMYVGMTRAKRELIVTGVKNGEMLIRACSAKSTCSKIQSASFG